MLSAGGCCEIAVTTHVKTAWKNFLEVQGATTSSHIRQPLLAMYTAIVCRASETWSLI